MLRAEGPDGRQGRCHRHSAVQQEHRHLRGKGGAPSPSLRCPTGAQTPAGEGRGAVTVTPLSNRSTDTCGGREGRRHHHSTVQQEHRHLRGKGGAPSPSLRCPTGAQTPAGEGKGAVTVTPLSNRSTDTCGGREGRRHRHFAVQQEHRHLQGKGRAPSPSLRCPTGAQTPAEEGRGAATITPLSNRNTDTCGGREGRRHRHSAVQQEHRHLRGKGRAPSPSLRCPTGAQTPAGEGRAAVTVTPLSNRSTDTCGGREGRRHRHSAVQQEHRHLRGKGGAPSPSLRCPTGAQTPAGEGRGAVTVTPLSNRSTDTCGGREGRRHRHSAVQQEHRHLRRKGGAPPPSLHCPTGTQTPAGEGRGAVTVTPLSNRSTDTCGGREGRRRRHSAVQQEHRHLRGKGGAPSPSLRCPTGAQTPAGEGKGAVTVTPLSNRNIDT